MPSVPQIRASRTPTGSVIDLSGDAIIVLDGNLRVRFWSWGAEGLFMVPAAAAAGKSWAELVAPDKPQQLLDARDATLADGHWEGELKCRGADGNTLYIYSRWEREAAVSGSEGVPLILVSITNMIAPKSATKPQSEGVNRRSFNTLFWHHPDGVFSLSTGGRITAANPALAVLTGYGIEALLTRPAVSLVSTADVQEVRRSFRQALAGTPQTRDLNFLRADGTLVEVQLTLLPQIVEDRIVGVHGIMRDVSQRRRDERRIVYLANHDPLTGLPNRNLLQDRMQHAILQAHRHRTRLGVLFMDLNRFKVINDSLGHDKGDQLLGVVADRLRKAVREADTVARLGGDEFVVLMEDVAHVDQVRLFATGLLEAICKPVDLGGQTVSISTSIGAAMYPDDGADPSALLKHADLAMYAAKDAGLDQFRFYEAEMNTRALSQLWREHGLRRAIADGELVLHYQPRLDLATNRLVAVEALVRWEHPERGLIYPANFIGLAEEIGVIGSLGEWVLQSACRQLRAWRDLGLHPIKVSVNVSPLQLYSEGFGDLVARTLSQSSLEPGALELEITENSLMENIDTISIQLDALRRLGVGLSIDDFGTGYSSLGYLKRLPVDTLKIDKSFIKDIPGDEDDAAIVRATIAMAHSMQLRVVAEGVTTFDQVWMLKAEGCDEIQGYLLCQPLAPAEMESYFRTCALRGIQYAWSH
jgi:diguanylate cyclase (GGDEF)-like protein/PAS domain S-box-containing protein